MNKPLLLALQRRRTSRVPVWLMRQAGRYLPEYRALRERSGGFLHMCKTPEIACEITLQPLRRFPLDAAIVFSDILTIPDAMGMGLDFIEGQGPTFARRVDSIAALNSLQPIDPAHHLAYVGKAIRLVRAELADDKALIGFSGSPWTIACYMIEGGSPRGEFSRAKAMLYEQPDVLRQLLHLLSEAIVDYLHMQLQAGADLVQIFDTWGGVLPASSYSEFSLAPMANIIARLRQREPRARVIVFTKGGGQWLEQIAASGCDALGVDWTCDLARARLLTGHQCAVQGNLDPAILRTNPATIARHTNSMLDSWGPHPGLIANLGHGITPDVPPEHVRVFVETVQGYNQQSAAPCQPI